MPHRFSAGVFIRKYPENTRLKTQVLSPTVKGLWNAGVLGRVSEKAISETNMGKRKQILVGRLFKKCYIDRQI